MYGDSEAGTVQLIHYLLNINVSHFKADIDIYCTSFRNRRHSNTFQWCPLWGLRYTVNDLMLLYIVQVPENLYFGQWPYITNIYQVIAIWNEMKIENKKQK